MEIKNRGSWIRLEDGEIHHRINIGNKLFVDGIEVKQEDVGFVRYTYLSQLREPNFL